MRTGAIVGPECGSARERAAPALITEGVARKPSTRVAWRTASGLIVVMNQRLKPLMVSFAVLAASALMWGTPSNADAAPYRGFVDVLNGQPTREASQGAGWRAVFRERVSGRVRYTVCLRNLDNDVGNCWRSRTGARGRSRIFVALFVNDQGGTGRWRARWKVAGRVVASWRFRVRPEFG